MEDMNLISEGKGLHFTWTENSMAPVLTWIPFPHESQWTYVQFPMCYRQSRVVVVTKEVTV